MLQYAGLMAYGDAEHVDEGWQACDMECDLSRVIFRRAWPLAHPTALIRTI